MNVLDLFSGIGGFSLGLERAGMRTIAFCEINPYCRATLARHWPGVPIHPDVRTLPRLSGVDVICGGVPCQPASTAGKRRGSNDERWLWPAFFEVVRAHGARWVVAENPFGIVSLRPDGLEWICGTFRDLGYFAWPTIISAHNVGAPHLRRRAWIVAHADRDGFGAGRREGLHRAGQAGQVVTSGSNVADADGGRCESLWYEKHSEQQSASRNQPHGCGERGRRHRQNVANAFEPGLSVPTHEELPGAGRRLEGGAVTQGGWWSAEPDLGRVAHGVPSRVDRLRALGNAVVPQIPEIIGRAIMRVQNGR